MQPLISLCIIARAPSHPLHHLINAAVGHVDEILVCFDLSTLPASLHRPDVVQYHARPLASDFSEQRNYLLSRAAHPWSLILDDDETLPEPLWPRLRSIAATASAPCVAFPRNNQITGCLSNYSWPDYHRRLFHSTLRYTGVVHEQIVAPTHYLPADAAHAILHTKSDADQRAAIQRYTQIIPLRQAILIHEHSRPDYLRVCLDALDRCPPIPRWSVLLSIDGPQHLAQFQHLFPRVQHVIPWSTHAGNLWHVTRSLAFAFSCAFDRVLFMDGDVILRPDTLNLIPDSTEFPSRLFYGFTKGPDMLQWFSPFANLVTRSMALPLLAYVNSRAWVGALHPVRRDPLPPTHDAYDSVYTRYMIDSGLHSHYQDRSYAAHIGLRGVNHASTPALESAIFRGPPESWLANAVATFNPSAHPAFIPTDFEYY